MPQYLMCSINQSIRIHHEYPMTLLKISNNSMIALLESLSSVREYQFIAWNVHRKRSGHGLTSLTSSYSPD